MRKHTPGPWFLEEPYTGTNRYPVTFDRGDNSRGTIAECYGQGGTREEVTVNALLIAAAPDLLEALEAISGWASDEGPLAGKGPMSISAFARAAIAKAKGGTP